MKRRTTYLLTVVFIAALFVFSSCRKDEEPTVTPTVTESDVEPTSQPTRAPATATPESSSEPETAPTPEEEVEPVLEIDWQPQLIYSSPAPGEEALLDGAITLRFDQPMDEVSVEEALTVQTAEDGGSVEGVISWPRTDTVIFTPSQELERKQDYKVELSDKAKGQNGKTMREPVSLRLQTVGFLEVSQVIPAPDTSEVQSDASITVVFNRPVVPLVSTDDQSNRADPLSIQPEVQGEGEWVSTSIYRFTPDTAFDGGQPYEITIPAGLEDVTGGVLDVDYVWDFTTEGPKVVSTTPYDGEENVDPSQPITVTFNMPMDRARTEGALTLSPSTNGQYVWSDGDRSVTFVPDGLLELETDYRLFLARSAQSANGQASLSNDVSVRFDTVPYPAVVGTRPGNGETADRYRRSLEVYFASPMDMDTLEDKLIISPEPEDASYYFNSYDFSLSVSFAMERNADYTVTVPGTAADQYGNTIGEDYTWSFQTPGYTPMASLNLPQGQSQLSTSYPTSVDIIHRNVSNLQAELRQADLPDVFLWRYGAEDPVAGYPLVQSWQIPLESAQDELGVYNLALAGGGILPTGVYHLQLNTPGLDSDAIWWQNRANVLIVADTNLIVKEMIDSIYVWATDLDTGQPAPGMNLDFYDVRGEFLGSAVTDDQGFADIDHELTEGYMTGVVVISNEPGEAGFGVGSSQWSEGIWPWQFGLESTGSDETERYVYLYTDRPIYRPGDTVHFKGVLRNTDYGRFPLPADQSVNLELFYLNDYETVDFEFTTTADENGEFDGEYVIPEDAALGNYALNFAADDIRGNRHFTVAEYRKPEFQVTVTPELEEVVRGDEVDVLIDANYFFGGAASDLSVSWSVYEQEYQFPWDGPDYRFGDFADYYFSWSRFGFGDGSFSGDYVTGGTGMTDGDGRLAIRLPADLLDDVDPGSRLVTIEATVQDVSDFPVTSRGIVVYHAADSYVGLRTDRWFTSAGVGTDVDVITVDWNGDPLPGQEVELTLFRREWNPVRESDFSGYYTRWEAEDTEEMKVSLVTDELGQATAELIPSDGGSYLIVAEVADGMGRVNTSSTFLWVFSPDFVAWRSDPNDRSMDLTLDQDEYLPGETARILVQSPFAGPVQAWLTIERGDLLEQRLITLETNSDVVELPILEEYAPNVFVSIHAVKGIDDSNPYADLRIGMTEVVVPPEHLGLNITLTPNSDLFQPGDTVSYDIQVTDHQGNPVRANLSLALVDLAVLSLLEDNAPPILDAFYAKQPMRSDTGSGLIISGEGLEIEIPLEIGGMGGGGGGLDDVALKAVALEEGDTVREDFPDTAFWRAKIATDANGQASIDIPLPDSLTTWRLSSKAVSEYTESQETLVGQDQADIVATLPLLIRPITPRFFTVGDRLGLGAVVHNNTDEMIEADVSLIALGLTHEGEARQSFDIPAGGRQVVRWPVVVEDTQFADLTFRVSGGGFSDATKPTFGIAPDQLIPVVRFSGEDTVGTSGVIDDADRRVEAVLLPEKVDDSRGELLLNLNPSLAAALFETLDYVNWLEEQPSCSHAVADQLLPNTAAYQALQSTGYQDEELIAKLEDLIQRDIQWLEQLQMESGGWGWCYSEEADPVLSAYALLALSESQKSGFSVYDLVIDRGMRYLRNQLQDVEDLLEQYQVNRQTYFLYVLSELGWDASLYLDDLFTQRRALLDPYARGLMLMAYENVGSSEDQQQTLISDLNNSVVLSATGAHWEDTVPDWNNLSSDIRGTAMIVTALVENDPENILLPNAVRWLMTARTADHWPTGQDTAWSVSALGDWMAESGELDINYDYKVALNGRGLGQGHFGVEDMLTSESMTAPVQDLKIDDVNFVDIQRDAGEGHLYYTLHLDSFIDANDLEDVNRGIIVQRAYYDADCDPEESECEPISDIESGQQVRVELTIIVPNDLVYAVVRDPIPAGAEAIDPGLETTGSSPGSSVTQVDNDYNRGYWGWWYFNRIEYRDEAVVFLSDFLPAGTYQFTYHLQTTIPGEYQVLPATATEEFFPEVFGRSHGQVFTITE